MNRVFLDKIGGSISPSLASRLFGSVFGSKPASQTQTDNETAQNNAPKSDHALISGCGKRCATFRDEDVGRCWCFSQELAQCPTFPGRYR